MNDLDKLKDAFNQLGIEYVTDGNTEYQWLDIRTLKGYEYIDVSFVFKDDKFDHIDTDDIGLCIDEKGNEYEC